MSLTKRRRRNIAANIASLEERHGTPCPEEALQELGINRVQVEKVRPRVRQIHAQIEWMQLAGWQEGSSPNLRPVDDVIARGLYKPC